MSLFSKICISNIVQIIALGSKVWAKTSFISVEGSGQAFVDVDKM